VKSAIVGTFKQDDRAQDYELRKSVRPAAANTACEDTLAERAARHPDRRRDQDLKGVTSIAYTEGDPVARQALAKYAKIIRIHFKAGVVEGA